MRSSYDVAKGGLEQATRTLAIELSRHGVLVNAVAPGFVADAHVDRRRRQRARERVVRGRLRPARQAAAAPLCACRREIAEHVAWLASDRNTYVTGQVLTVDGGVTVTF